MKNLFKNLMLVAVAAMGFTACEQVIDDVNATNETFTVNIVGEFADDTRSGFDGKNDAGTGYKSAWDGEETVRFAIIPDTFEEGAKATYVDVENESEGNRATFAPTFDSNEGTIHAFSPKGVFDSTDASACKGGFTSNAITLKYNNAYVVVPAVQTPLANSVDPAAHILAGKADFAENVNMTFNHVVAYGKMTIKNFAGDIDKVEVTASESLAGISCKYFYNEGNLDNANVKTITLHPTYVVDNVFWFGCAPADLSDGTLTVKVYSGEDTYTKELAISGENFKFQQGHVASFGVDMTDVAKDEIVEDDEIVVDWVDDAYNLVKSAAHLEVGDKVIIVAKGTDAALSTTQNNNNRAQAAVTKKDDTVTFSNDVQILTLEEGTTEGTYAFNTGSGYLYAASGSSNHLKTKAELDANGSWTIEIAADGVATIKAQGTYTHNWMRYNQQSKLFSCYSSGQDDICIYKLVGEYTPTVPAISYTVADVLVAYDATSGEATVEATNGDGWAFSATTEATWVEDFEYADSKISFSINETNESKEKRNAIVTVKATKTGYDDVTTTFTITQGVKPGEGGSDVAEQLVTFDFTNISGFSSWGNSYAKHTVEYDDATVVFEAASHQTGTITNMPVTKGKTVEIKAKNNATMKAVKFTCAKWSSKAQTITLHYSTNGGSSYTSTGKTSSNFSIEDTELPTGTNAVKITFSSSSNQVGIQAADVTFLK